MAGLIGMAAQGRNGDNRMAHVTPGEVVIPKEVAALRPDLVAHVEDTVRKMGGNPSSLTVGRGRVNPATGIEEFATEAEVRAAYQSVLGRAPEAEGLALWMGQNDLSGFRAAAAPELAATGYQPAAAPTRDTVNQVYQSTFGRPAEDAGANYWLDQATKNPGLDLNAAIGANAQGADVTARTDIAAGGVDTATTWGNGATLAAPTLNYDAANNTWGSTTAAPVGQSATGATAAQMTAPIIAAPTSATATMAQTAAPVTAVNAVQDQARGTVAGQIEGLINANSPLMQRAAQSGLDMVASRGLINSGMAIESAQNAVYDYAIPIASADSASNNQFGLINADTANTTNRYNTSNQQQTNLINADASNQTSQFNAQQSNAIATENARMAADAARYNAQAQNQMVLQQLDQANRIQLADIQATYSNQMQTSQSSASLFNSAMSALNNIQQSTTMDAPTKQKAIDDQVAMLRAAMSHQGAITNLDLTSVLDFTV